MHFDLVDLRLLVSVIEAGSMAEAARRAHISVSALHERMKLLEERAGVPLLERTVRGSKPTHAGATVAESARVILLQAERLSGVVEGWKSRQSGVIRVRANSNAVASFLPDVLARFLARHPDVVVDLREETSDRIARAIRSGDADLGVAASNADLEGTETRPLVSDRLVLVAPPGHRLAGRRQVSFVEVLDESFIGLDEQSAIHAYLGEHARRLGREMTVRIRLRSFESVCRMVAVGAGVSIVPVSVVPHAVPGTGLGVVRLSEPWAQRDLVICIARDRPVSELVQRLLDELPKA